jgi:hypothetical protein
MLSLVSLINCQALLKTIHYWYSVSNKDNSWTGHFRRAVELQLYYFILIGGQSFAKQSRPERVEFAACQSSSADDE